MFDLICEFQLFATVHASTAYAAILPAFQTHPHVKSCCFYPLFAISAEGVEDYISEAAATFLVSSVRPSYWTNYLATAVAVAEVSYEPICDTTAL